MAASLVAQVTGVSQPTVDIVVFSTVGIGLMLLGRWGLKEKELHVPSKKLNIRTIFELLIEFVSGMVEMVMGKEGRHFVPFFTTIFTFLLTCNLVGMIPGMTPPTENLNCVLAVGILIFIFYNILGFKFQKFGYIKHFFGPIIWLAPFMFVIELLSHVVRPVTLGLRMSNVLKGDHMVLSLFLDLVPLGVPIAFYLLGFFICFVQAYVFTLLSMLYVHLAVSHDH